MKAKQDIQRPEGQKFLTKTAAGLKYFGVITTLPLKNLTKNVTLLNTPNNQLKKVWVPCYNRNTWRNWIYKLHNVLCISTFKYNLTYAPIKINYRTIYWIDSYCYLMISYLTSVYFVYVYLKTDHPIKSVWSYQERVIKLIKGTKILAKIKRM